MRAATALQGVPRIEPVGPFPGLLLTRALRPSDAIHNHRAYFVA